MVTNSGNTPVTISKAFIKGAVIADAGVTVNPAGAIAKSSSATITLDAGVAALQAGGVYQVKLILKRAHQSSTQPHTTHRTNLTC